MCTIDIKQQYFLPLLMYFWTLSAWVQQTSGQRSYQVEVCDSFMFNTSCHHGEVVFIKSAMYGRKAGGRCVQQMKTSCMEDITDFLQRKCSGRRQCSVTISTTDPYLKARAPCSKDYTWHLYATYQCLPVQTADRNQCKLGNPIDIVATSTGHLSSHYAKEGPGRQNCPWRIQAQKDQQIQLVAYNLLQNKDPGRNSGRCLPFARVQESNALRPVQLCRDDPGMKVFYTSKTNIVVFYFTDFQHEYLVYYKVVGCQNLPKIQGAVFNRTSNRLLVTCQQSHEHWWLTCVDQAWKGRLTNCSLGDYDASAAVQQGWTIFDSREGFPYALVLVVAIGVALGILLGGTTLIIVSYRMKRKIPRYEMPPEPCANYNMTNPGRTTKDDKNHTSYTGSTNSRRHWSADGTMTTSPGYTHQVDHQQGTHISQHKLPDYKYTFGGNRDSAAISAGTDTSHCSPHLYESPQVT